MIRNSNIYSIVLAVFGGMILTACGAGDNDPGLEYAPNMYHSVPYEPLKQVVDKDKGEWAEFLDSNEDGYGEYYNSNPLNQEGMDGSGMTMRTPPENSVRRDKYLPYRIPKDSLYWFVRYGFRDQGGVSYSDDLFRLIGLGNYEFQGDTANADGLSFQRSRYDYLDFGLIKYFPNRSNLSVSLGVTRGIRLIDLKANQLSVYTEEYGTSTNWAIDMNARLTPALEQTLADYHGMGAQISADYKGLLGPEGAYAVGIHNLGFVRWKGSEYTKKANFTYDGWYIPDWNDLEGNGKEAFDSVAALFRPDSTGFTKTRFLPAYAYAEYTMKFRKRQAVTFRFDQVFNQVMTPRITVEHLFFWSRFYTTTRLSFGGYGRFNWTQDIGYQRGRHLFHLQLYGIDGYIVPSKSSGLGAGFRYGINF